MNRTLKLQLSNLKQSVFMAAIISYGLNGLFLLFLYLIDSNIFADALSKPFWLNVFVGVVAPLSFLGVLYALWDGLMYLDTAIRFGISRGSYFVFQIIIYAFLAVLLALSSGAAEVEWTGVTSAYWATLGDNYLTFGNIVGEFLQMLLIASALVAFYRYKAKVFIPGAVLFGLFMLIVSFTSNTENPTYFMMIINTITFVNQNLVLFTGIITVIAIGVYYLFITTTEVQD